MIQKIKKDLEVSWVGILILLLVWIGTVLFGGGMCVLKNKWGIPCPGCGMTRSILLIFQGRFEEAWVMQPFAYGWLVLLIIFIINRYVIGKKEIVWKAMLVLLCVGMLLRYVFVVLPGFW